MEGVVERRPDQVVHRRVDDQEVLRVAFLHEDHFRDEDAGIADDQPARLEHHLQAELGDVLAHDFGIGIGQGRRAVVDAVGDAEATAEIDMVDGVAVGAQRADQFSQQRERVVEGLQFGDLATDMGVDAGDLDARKLGGAGIDLAGALPRDAELVLGLAGGDLLVGPGVDIRVDAQRDGGHLAQRHGAGRKQFELRLGFDVEAQYAGPQGEVDLASRLADPGKQDLGGGNTGGERTAQLAFRDHVGAGAKPRQRAQHGLVGVSLHGIADQRVEAREGLAEDAVMPGQRRGRIAVEGSADLRGDIWYRHVLGMKDAVAVFEMVHGNGSGSLERGATGPSPVRPALDQRIEDELLVLDRFRRLRGQRLLGLLGVLARLHGRFIGRVESGFPAAGRDGRHRRQQRQRHQNPATGHRSIRS